MYQDKDTCAGLHGHLLQVYLNTNKDTLANAFKHKYKSHVIISSLRFVSCNHDFMQYNNNGPRPSNEVDQ